MGNQKEQSISAGTACFLIRDDSLYQKWDAEFYAWLRDHGFSRWLKGKGCCEGVNWIYVNLNSRLYTPGMPGIPVTQIVGDHAITIDEFKQIYEIYAKYDGLRVLQFEKAEAETQST